MKSGWDAGSAAGSARGGRSWQVLGSEGYFALGLTPSGVGFAVGAEGRITRLEFEPSD